MQGNGHRPPGFHKKTYRLGHLARDVAALLPHVPELDAIWRRRRLDPALREEIMLSVARLNESRWCNFAHGRFARHEGVPESRLKGIERRTPEAFDRRSWAAMEWARARSAADFAPAPTRVEREARAVLDAQALRDVETVARLMTISNLSANTFDALLSRLSGNPAPHGRVVDEVVIGALAAAGIAAVGVRLAVLERVSPAALMRAFRTSSDAFERARAAVFAL